MVPEATTHPVADADEVLATTRSVRSGLDLTRPVARELIEECIELALQAPSGSNIQNAHFIVVTDPEKRRAVGDVYRRGWQAYMESPWFFGKLAYDDYRQQPGEAERFQEWAQMAAQQVDWLVEHMHEVPVLVIPCVSYGEGPARSVLEQSGLTRDTPLPFGVTHAATYGNVLPAATQFRLAARARGLGSCWTVVHLFHEKDAADVLGIPYEAVIQTALIPVAHTSPEEFSRAQRPPLSDAVHWDAW